MPSFCSYLRLFTLSLLSTLGMLTGTPSYAQVSVNDVALNATMVETNRLITDLMLENQSTLTYLNNIGYYIGLQDNLSLEEINYPSELLAPQAIEQIGFTQKDFKPTSLTTPALVEEFLTGVIIPAPGETYTQTQKDTFGKYQMVLSHRAVLEGYIIAYLARMKSAGTSEFLQKSLRERIIKSSSVREDLAIENLAMAEIVGQLGTLVATSASELEISSSLSLMGITF